MSTEETTNEPASTEASFAPPIKVAVHTNNLSRCELRISGGDGVAEVIVVPSDGNVYQGLHHARAGLEEVINRLLAKNGVLAPEPEPAAEGDTVPEPAETDPAAPAPKKKAAAKAKAAAEAK